MVCDATLILHRKIIQPTKVQLVTGAVPDSQLDRVRFHFSTSLSLKSRSSMSYAHAVCLRGSTPMDRSPGRSTATDRPSGRSTTTGRPSGRPTATDRPSGRSTTTGRPSGRPTATDRLSVQLTGAGRASVTPDAIIVGTSLVRGLGARFGSMGIDATCYTYTGQEIAHIREQVCHIFSADYQQYHCAVWGGMMQIVTPPHKVVREYDKLVRKIRNVCPLSTISLNSIPMSDTNKVTLENIAKINTNILCNRGKRGDGILSVNLCLSDRLHFKKDLFVQRQSHYLAHFRACLLSKK